MALQMVRNDIPGKRVAIVIGTNEYDNSRVHNLRGSAQDVMNLTRILQDPKVGGYEVKMFVNAPSQSINRAIEQFFGGAHNPNDTVLFY